MYVCMYVCMYAAGDSQDEGSSQAVGSSDEGKVWNQKSQVDDSSLPLSDLWMVPH